MKLMFTIQKVLCCNLFINIVGNTVSPFCEIVFTVNVLEWASLMTSHIIRFDTIRLRVSSPSMGNTFRKTDANDNNVSAMVLMIVETHSNQPGKHLLRTRVYTHCGWIHYAWVAHTILGGGVSMSKLCWLLAVSGSSGVCSAHAIWRI